MDKFLKILAWLIHIQVACLCLVLIIAFITNKIDPSQWGANWRAFFVFSIVIYFIIKPIKIFPNE